MSDIVERLRKVIVEFDLDRQDDIAAATETGERIDLYPEEVEVPLVLISDATDEIVCLRKEHADRVRERDEAIETGGRIASQFSSLLALIGQIYVDAEKDRKEADE